MGFVFRSLRRTIYWEKTPSITIICQSCLQPSDSLSLGRLAAFSNMHRCQTMENWKAESWKRWSNWRGNLWCCSGSGEIARSSAAVSLEKFVLLIAATICFPTVTRRRRLLVVLCNHLTSLFVICKATLPNKLSDNKVPTNVTTNALVSHSGTPQTLDTITFPFKNGLL